MQLSIKQETHIISFYLTFRLVNFWRRFQFYESIYLVNLLFLSVHPFVYLFICLVVLLKGLLSVCPSICISVYLSNYLSNHLSIYLSNHYYYLSRHLVGLLISERSSSRAGVLSLTKANMFLSKKSHVAT